MRRLCEKEVKGRLQELLSELTNLCLLLWLASSFLKTNLNTTFWFKPIIVHLRGRMSNIVTFGMSGKIPLSLWKSQQVRKSKIGSIKVRSTTTLFSKQQQLDLKQMKIIDYFKYFTLNNNNLRNQNLYFL